MATKLAKPVYRESRAMVRDRSKFRPLIAGLVPGDVLTLRMKGCRQVEMVPFDTLYHYAVRLRVAAERAARVAARKARGT